MRRLVVVAALLFAFPAAAQNSWQTWVNGDLRLSGAATVYTDVTTSSERAAVGGGSPSYAQVVNGAYAYKLGEGDSIRFSIQIPHSVVTDSSIDAHCHVGPDGTDGDGGSAKFTVECSWADINDAFAATNTLTSLSTAMGTGTATHLYVDLGDFTNATHGVNDNVSTIGLCTFTRIDDTGGAGDYTGDVWVWGVDFHVEVDSLGSRTETTK